jgi:uncharacterized protein
MAARGMQRFGTVSGEGESTVKAVLVLVAAILLCGLIVYFGPAFAESLISYLPAAQQQSMPALETLFTLVIFGGLLAFAAIGGGLSRVNPFRIGRRPLQSLSIGLSIGVGGIVAAAALAWIAGTVQPAAGLPQQASLLVWGAAVIFFQTASEEVYFRGWLQPALARHWGPQAAVVVAALAFAALHVMGGARSPTTLINMFLGGLLFGYLASYGHGLAGALGAHFAWNATEQILLGLDPNPGLGSFGALLDLELAGSAAWGGSDEGLNASVAMTFALLALVVPLLILEGRPGHAAPKVRRAV